MVMLRSAIIALPAWLVDIMEMISDRTVVAITRPASVIISFDNRVAAAIRDTTGIIVSGMMGAGIQQQHQGYRKYLFN